MSKSNCEEIIGILWIILSLMLFGRSHIIWGWVALILGISSVLGAIWYALKKV